MPLTPDVVTRTDDAAGDAFLTFLDGTGRRSQAVVLVNLNGDPMGVTGTPVVVATGSNEVLIDSTTPVNVNIASTTHTHTHVVSATAGAAVANALIYSGVTTLVEFRVLLDPTVSVDRWVMLFDSIAAIGTLESSAPLWRIFVPAGAEASETWNPSGLEFADGITVAVSSTIAVLTLTGAEAFFHAIRY